MVSGFSVVVGQCNDSLCKIAVSKGCGSVSREVVEQGSRNIFSAVFKSRNVPILRVVLSQGSTSVFCLVVSQGSSRVFREVVSQGSGDMCSVVVSQRRSSVFIKVVRIIRIFLIQEV